ncbi:MAG: DUF4149 domain-containing protein [Pseudomonadota bacterium]
MITAAISAVFGLSLAVLVGGMTFFPAVVAPRVFKTLDADAASRFLRDLFPGYYAFIILASGIAALAAIGLDWRYAAALALIAATTAPIRQVLTPQLNRWRDAELAGDAAAGARFKRGHRLSVLVNIAQLVTALGVLVHWAVRVG